MKLTELIISRATKRGIDPAIISSVFDACDENLYKIIGAEGLIQNAYDLIYPNFEGQDVGILVRDTEVKIVTEKAFRVSVTDVSTGNKTLYWVPKSVVKVIDGRHVIPFWVLKNGEGEKVKKVYSYDKPPHEASVLGSDYNEPPPWE
jgi:hypothetical protein